MICTQILKCISLYQILVILFNSYCFLFCLYFIPDCRRPHSYQYGQMVTDTTSMLTERKVLSFEHCNKVCRSKTSCRSLDYNFITGICRTFASNSKAMDSTLVYHQDYEYLEGDCKGDRLIKSLLKGVFQRFYFIKLTVS